MTRDWIAAFDDVLTGRHRRCTQCGRQGGEGEYTIVEHHTRSLAVLIWHRCRAEDPTRAKLEALLTTRYGWKATA